MYDRDLEQARIPVEQIFLDPNNPRFWTETTVRHIPDSKIPDERIQLQTLERIKRHEVDQLIDSIIRNGFLTIDRIVVRRLLGVDNQYVVVEGNRRLAALTVLRQRIDEQTIAEDGVSEQELARLKTSTDKLEVLLYIGEDTSDVAWLFQGIRHVSGIRDWEPAQRGKLVATQIDEHDLKFREAGQRFGLTPHKVGRYYRTFKALEQMRRDDEFQNRAHNRYFTLFEEAIRNKDVKSWLGWNDKDHCFENQANLHQFYCWITPDDDDEDKRRRIHDPRQIKKLAFLIAEGHDGLISQIDQHETTIDSAHDRARQMGIKYDWQKSIERATQMINDIPQAAISDNPSEVLACVEILLQQASHLKTMAQALVEEGTSPGAALPNEDETEY